MGEIVSGDRRIAIDEIKLRAERAAGGLSAFGIGPGDSIALLLRNDFAFFEAAEAASRLGAYSVLINWHFTPEEIRYILEDSGARAIVAHEDLLRAVPGAIPEGVIRIVVPVPPEIAATYPAPPAPPLPAGTLEWESLTASDAPVPVATPIENGAVYYTSGTTGRPKGVKRLAGGGSREALMRSVSRMFGLEQAIFGSSGERVASIVAGPMYHAGPNAAAGLAIAANATLVLVPRFEPEEFLALIERHRVTHLYMVPTMFIRLLALPEAVRQRYDLSSVKWVIHTAAPCPPHVKRAMIAWWGNVINEYYAATETFPTAFISAQEWLEHPGSIGRAVDGVTIRILGEDDSILPPGEVGEVYAQSKSAQAFTYHNAEQKRRDAERDGFISVGDIGYLDEEGYLTLCDRKSFMIISGGVNIYPAEIEAEILQIAGVRDVAVFGIPDDEFGERPAAHVELEPGSALTADQIAEALAGRLARYKIPRTICFDSALPRDDNGKIYKKGLRQPYLDAAKAL